VIAFVILDYISIPSPALRERVREREGKLAQLALTLSPNPSPTSGRGEHTLAVRGELNCIKVHLND